MPEPAQPIHLRLFVAVSLPEDVKARVLEAQHALRAAVPGAPIRWTKPEQFHLTLRFLGSVDAVNLAPLEGTLLSVCSRFGPLQLRSGQIGFFPRPHSPRVVWAGVRDAAELLPSMQQAIQSATAGYTLEPPEDRFTGHVTLARVKDLRRPEAELLTAAAARFSNRTFGEWVGTEVHLIRSQLNPQGARYTVAGSYPLSGPPATNT